MNTKKTKTVTDETPTRSQKQQKMARIVAIGIIVALVLSFVIPAIVAIVDRLNGF